MLRPPDAEDPERILVIGGPGSGKSTGWLNIAEWSQRTGSPAKFYVIDSDRATPRMLKGYPQLANMVDYRLVHHWEGYDKALKEFSAVITPEDWLVVDFVGSTWDAVQEWYIEQVFGQESDQFFLDARLKMKSGAALDGWKDWSVINRIHRAWMNKLIHDTPGHRYLTAVADKVQDTDDKRIKEIFGRFGVKPRGQKHLAHAVHTVLLLQTQGDRYFINSAKDRERELLLGDEMADFTASYLVKVAGWEL